MQYLLWILIVGFPSFTDAAEATRGLQVIGQSSPGGMSDATLWGLLIALLAIVLLIVLRALRPRRPEIEEKKRPSLPAESESAPSLQKDLESAKMPSLREIKEARAARITEDIASKEALYQARQARKGATREAIEKVELSVLGDVEDTEPLAQLPPLRVVEPASQEALEAVAEEPGEVDVAGAESSAAEVLLDKASPEIVPAKAQAIPLKLVKPTPAPKLEEAEPQKSLEEGLQKTRSGFIRRLKGLFSKKRTLDDELMAELEEVLFTADIGVKTSQDLLEKVEAELSEHKEIDAEQAWTLLREETARILQSNQKPLEIGPMRPNVILVIGVNGVGKTTTIGKLASKFQAKGLKVLLVAGDTFRAAAIDQLTIWGQRVGCQVFTAPEGRDPSSVVFDGIKLAQDDHLDVVLVDTAGRLHTKVNLVEELKKVRRVSDKAFKGSPHHVLLVLDANTGQNAISQAQMFHKEVGVTGIILTKLDGTAKGGVVIGISDELEVPVQYIGIGEQLEDLRPFNAREFVDAIFA